ncbi:xylosyltransferase oxt isoform X2 [Thrips palmi]|uniref:protein xylosyltransferase n=1 Tax=Thrips palmi TaxID=161013 RepID=A0A6P8ZX80_THRPL|nr:xylosyltransferase oxt isoform X2 [Thrips palmi]
MDSKISQIFNMWPGDYVCSGAFSAFNEDPNGAASSRRFKENYLALDDEDIPMNALFNRHKVPPDKTSNRQAGSSVTKSANVPSASVTRTGVSSVNKTVLRLEELDFIPLCEISNKEAVSAIHRAKTQLCKQEIANTTCLINDSSLYPKTLKMSCPLTKGITPGKSLGCFKDEKNLRRLNGYSVTLKTTNSPEHCINICLQSGFPYAGVQYSVECFCGNNRPESSSRLPDSSCNMKCPADPRKACGGYYTINVYQTGIPKFTPQVPSASPLRNEPSARVAYLLTLNGRGVRQVRRLFKTLYHQDHFFYIHVDARQDYLFRELLVLETQFPNVKLARKRYATIWGGASLLQMLLSSMTYLLSTDWKWDFVINLSESDFPIKSNTQLVKFLTANKQYNFVKSHGREAQRFIQKQGLDKSFVECEAHMWRIGNRQLPWGIQIDGGSDWVALSRTFVAFVTSSEQDDLVEGLLTVFKRTLLPAESFFHTILRNSKFCDTYVDNNLHVTNWKRRLGCKCQYQHVVDWCGCSPNVFKVDDWSRLQSTEQRQLYFARKFDPTISQLVIDKVEEWLYGATPSNLQSKLSYWQSVYNYLDLSPQADDGLLTVSASLARHASHKVENGDSSCSLKVLKVLEVTSYFHNDSYKGSLVRFEATQSSTQEILELETWVSPISQFNIIRKNQVTIRLKSLLISSEYDMKEQMSRNFLRVLGPFSDPVLVATLESNATGAISNNMTFLWIDPTGQLAEVSEMHIEYGHLVGYVKPSLQSPLLPGVWDVRLVRNGTVWARVQFLVSPLEIMSGVPITQQQTGFVHSGPGAPYKHAHLAGEWDPLLGSTVTSRLAAERKALANARRFGQDLLQWIDGLTQRFYSVVDTCVSTSSYAKLQASSCASNWGLEPCVATMWSSFTPDPKSKIMEMDFNTGGLKRW